MQHWEEKFFFLLCPAKLYVGFKDKLIPGSLSLTCATTEGTAALSGSHEDKDPMCRFCLPDRGDNDVGGTDGAPLVLTFPAISSKSQARWDGGVVEYVIG